MNYIRHLSGFFDRVASEDRLNPTHISLYMSLFQFWNLNRFVNPISISRSEMMSVSKICSKATYHKVIKELNEFGFIQYEPSYNPFRGSAVYLISFEKEVNQKVNRRHAKNKTSDEQVVNTYHTKIETSTEPLNEPYINNTNIVNSKLAKEQAHENTSSNFDESNPQEKKPHGRNFGEGRKRSTPGLPAEASAKVGRATLPLPTSVNEVQTFFENEKSTKHEAEKFFNYFQSNGWKVGGRAPMRDWNAAARNWILNSDKFNSKKTMQTLHASTVKDYGEPL